MSPHADPSAPHSAPAATQPRPRNYWEWLGLLALLALAAALRFYALDHSSLWSDEGNTWALVQRSFAHIARDAGADIHPPGYYWLLKVWSALWGTSAYALRAFSALCGVLLVASTWWLARQLAQMVTPGVQPWARIAAWTAGLLIALNPLQVYYSQEARMYMPLALAGVGLYAASLAYVRREAAGVRIWGSAIAFWFWGALGLWLHYSFPILLLGAGLSYLAYWFSHYRPFQPHPLCGRWHSLIRFALLCTAILLSFAPWIPTAMRQLLIWPQGNVPVTPAQGLRLTLETLLFGPLAELPSAAIPAGWLWLTLGGILPLLGLWALWRHSRPDRGRLPALVLVLWLLLPIGMMFGLGLFTDAFLKFLLTASPAWAIALSWAVCILPLPQARRWWWAAQLPIIIGAIVLAALLLPTYYTSPTARDNYAGVARYITAQQAANPLVLLNAPGQADVWGYYDPGVPVLALPAMRPPDRAATEATLAHALQDTDTTRIFALYWGDNEADPERIVETWLDTHAFPGLESWQGNLRFVDYSLPPNLRCDTLPAPQSFTDMTHHNPLVTLVGHCHGHTAQLASPADTEFTTTAGQVLLMGLVWEFPAHPQPQSTDESADDAIAVSLQVLDARNQVIAQRDAPLPRPQVESRDAADQGIQAVQIVRDNHGIPIPVGTPPGDYRLILALYQPATGLRLEAGESDALVLGTLHINRAPVTATPLIDAMYNVRQPLGPVTLLGYDLHRRDFAHAPATPIQPGDPVQLTLYWQAPPTLPPDWPQDLALELVLGGQRLHAPLAGDGYPTGEWQPGEVVRARFELTYFGGPRRIRLLLANDQMELAPLP